MASESDRSCTLLESGGKISSIIKLQNPYRRIPIFMAVYKGRQEITNTLRKGSFYLINRVVIVGAYKCSLSTTAKRR
jgi:hypothetical protein